MPIFRDAIISVIVDTDRWLVQSCLRGKIQHGGGSRSGARNASICDGRCMLSLHSYCPGCIGGARRFDVVGNVGAKQTG